MRGMHKWIDSYYECARFPYVNQYVLYQDEELEDIFSVSDQHENEDLLTEGEKNDVDSGSKYNSDDMEMVPVDQGREIPGNVPNYNETKSSPLNMYIRFESRPSLEEEEEEEHVPKTHP